MGNSRGCEGLDEHILRRLKPDELYIIVCDEEFKIIQLSTASKLLFDVDTGYNVADFVDYDVCKGIKHIIDTKGKAVFQDKIDDMYFSIDVEEHRGQAVLFFKDINEILQNDISNFAKTTSESIQKYIDTNEFLTKSIKDKTITEQEFAKVLKKERKAMLKLVEFSAKVENIVQSETLNITGFDTQNFTEFMTEIVENIQKFVPNCNINLVVADNIICEFCNYKITVAIMNLLSGIFKNYGTDTEIKINVYEKAVKVHFVLSYDTRGLKIEQSGEDKIGEFAIKNIIVNKHKGMYFKNQVDNLNEAHIIFPIMQSCGDEFAGNSVIYKRKYSKSLEILKTLKLYN